MATKKYIVQTPPPNGFQRFLQTELRKIQQCTDSIIDTTTSLQEALAQAQTDISDLETVTDGLLDDVAALNPLLALLPISSGTWTAVVRGAGTAGTYEISLNRCHYLRIGTRIFLDVYILLAGTVTGGGSSYVKITGLPYGKLTNMNYCGPVEMINMATGGPCFLEFDGTAANSNELYIRHVATSGVSTDYPVSGVGANAFFIGSINYETPDP